MDARKRWTLVAVAAIWIAVVITSFASKDLISGSEQEHLNIAAMINWLWGALATMSLARLARLRRAAPDSSWVTIGVGTTFIWMAVTLAAAFGPSLETGSDPTSIPFPAIIAPIAGMLLTRFLAEFVLETPPDEGAPEPAPHKDIPPIPGSGNGM
jgi:predicted MFS family arabinose efflux permease